jgi:hypothetical protein
LGRRSAWRHGGEGVPTKAAIGSLPRWLMAWRRSSGLSSPSRGRWLGGGDFRRRRLPRGFLADLGDVVTHAV